MSKGDDKRIGVFNNKCLRQILNVHWKDHVSTFELLERAQMKPLSKEIQQRRWKMIGHILRQKKDNHSNIALNWSPEGKRKKGRKGSY